MLNPEIKTVTPEEYFEMEEKCEYKNEYYHGEILPKTGESLNHNVIAGNTATVLHTALKNRNFFVFLSAMRVEVDAGRHYAYPDLSIVCGDVELVENRDDAITNPMIIIEILSESSRDYDRGFKFGAYRSIDSLEGYILIDQYHCHVEYFYKHASGQWRLEEYKNISDQFMIRPVDVELELSAVYHRVEISEH